MKQTIFATNFRIGFMIQTIKNIFSTLKPLDFAILLCSVGLNFMKLVPYGLLLIVIALIYELFIAKNLRVNHEIKSSIRRNIFLFIPFLLAIWGFFFTSNFGKAFEDLGRILPFLLFPIFFSFISSERRKHLGKFVLFGFVLGLVIRFLIDLFESAMGYTNDFNIQIFFYTYLDADTNILAIITMFATLYLLDFQVVNSKFISIKQRNLTLVLALFFSLCILLLQSRIVILFFFLGLGLLFLNHWKKKEKWSILATLLFASLFMLIPAFQGRFQVVASETKKINESKELLPSDTVSIENLPCMSSTELRFNALKASWAIIKRNSIFGVGTGDWLDELVKEYTISDMPCNAYEQTAPHNQYMRTLLKYGFFGLAIYLIYLFFLFNFFKKQRKVGQLPLFLTLLLCGLGYDLIDVGSSAPVFAFFTSWLFLKENT